MNCLFIQPGLQLGNIQGLSRLPPSRMTSRPMTVSTERLENSPAVNGIVGRQSAVCQDTQQDYRDTHEIVTTCSSLKRRFYLNYHETLLTVQLNPVVNTEEMYVMNLDVTNAT